MINDDQRRNIDLKIMKVTSLFLKHPTLSIEEISEKTGISKSSVQRYLNDPRIIELFDEEIYNTIQDFLKINRLESQRKGGFRSSKNNIPLRDSDGKFNGNRKR